MDQKTIDKFAQARRSFPHTRGKVYFNCAAQAPFSKEMAAALDDYVQLRIDCSSDDHSSLRALARKMRSDIASLVGARPSQIGFSPHTTFGLNLAAFGLPLKKDSEVLLHEKEFPAAVYTWRTAAEIRNLKIKFVGSVNDHFCVDDFRKKITERTKVLCLSWVQFYNGYKNDLRQIGEICREHDIYFVVDGIQGMGVEPINLHQPGIDIFCSGAQKWMLSSQGSGFFYLSDKIQREMVPPVASWMDVDWGGVYTDLFHYDKPILDSAIRFEMGYYNVLNLVALAPPVKLIKNLGLSNIQEHNYTLIDRLAKYIKTNPFYRISSSLERKHRSSTFTFSCDQVSDLHAHLNNSQIVTALREGSIRVAVHLYNDESDIDRLIKELASFAGNHH